MKKSIKVLLVATVIALFSSCATIISGSKQMVTFSSEPSGAKIMIDGVPIGKTPLTTKIKRGSRVIVISKDNYETFTRRFDRKFNAWVIGNIVLGGIPGIATDLITGAYITIDDNIYIELQSK